MNTNQKTEKSSEKSADKAANNFNTNTQNTRNTHRSENINGNYTNLRPSVINSQIRGHNNTNTYTNRVEGRTYQSTQFASSTSNQNNINRLRDHTKRIIEVPKNEIDEGLKPYLTLVKDAYQPSYKYLNKTLKYESPLMVDYAVKCVNLENAKILKEIYEGEKGFLNLIMEFDPMETALNFARKDDVNSNSSNVSLISQQRTSTNNIEDDCSHDRNKFTIDFIKYRKKRTFEEHESFRTNKGIEEEDLVNTTSKKRKLNEKALPEKQIKIFELVSNVVNVSVISQNPSIIEKEEPKVEDSKNTLIKIEKEILPVSPPKIEKEVQVPPAISESKPKEEEVREQDKIVSAKKEEIFHKAPELIKEEVLDKESKKRESESKNVEFHSKTASKGSMACPSFISNPDSNIKEKVILSKKLHKRAMENVKVQKEYSTKKKEQNQSNSKNVILNNVFAENQNKIKVEDSKTVNSSLITPETTEVNTISNLKEKKDSPQKELPVIKENEIEPASIKEQSVKKMEENVVANIEQPLNNQEKDISNTKLENNNTLLTNQNNNPFTNVVATSSNCGVFNSFISSNNNPNPFILQTTTQSNEMAESNNIQQLNVHHNQIVPQMNHFANHASKKSSDDMMIDKDETFTQNIRPIICTQPIQAIISQNAVSNPFQQFSNNANQPTITNGYILNSNVPSNNNFPQINQFAQNNLLHTNTGIRIDNPQNNNNIIPNPSTGMINNFNQRPLHTQTNNLLQNNFSMPQNNNPMMVQVQSFNSGSGLNNNNVANINKNPFENVGIQNTNQYSNLNQPTNNVANINNNPFSSNSSSYGPQNNSNSFANTANQPNPFGNNPTILSNPGSSMSSNPFNPNNNRNNGGTGLGLLNNIAPNRRR